MSDATTTAAEQAERLADAERRRVDAMGRWTGLGRRLDGRPGHAAATFLTRARGAYRRLRARAGLPV